MIKFLYMTDPHMKGVSPGTRVDSFPLTIENKINDFFAYGHEQNVDFFVCGGDFMDSPYVTQRYVKRIGKLFKEGLKGKEMFFVWGNHDIVAWNPKTIEDTSFGLFEAFCEEMTLLSADPIRRTYNGQTIELSGISSYARLDRNTVDEDGDVTEPRARDYTVKTSPGDPKRIHVVHGYLSPDPILEDIPHTLISEMVETDALITLTGHEHTGFPVTKTSKGVVYNPGALGRVFASHTEMNRMPKYALCTIQGGAAEVVPVQCRVAKLGTEVMDRTLLDEKRLREKMLAEARGSIKEVLSQISIQSVGLGTIISRFEDTVSKEVYDETKRRLQL